MILFSRRDRFFVLIGLIHLLVVAIGASAIGFGWIKVFSEPLSYYGALSGAGTDYGFFAPGIPAEFRAVIEVTGSNISVVRNIDFGADSGREADLRFGSIFQKAAWGPDYENALILSLTKVAFQKYPEAEIVGIRIEKYDPVSLAEFRHGKGSRWQLSSDYQISRLEFFNESNK